MCEEINKNNSLDKIVASEIQKKLTTTEVTADGCAGWHVICGKHFALSITYNTKWTLFFDLLEGCNKTFLVFKTQWEWKANFRKNSKYNTTIISLRKLQKNDVYAVIKFKFLPIRLRFWSKINSFHFFLSFKRSVRVRVAFCKVQGRVLAYHLSVVTCLLTDVFLHELCYFEICFA